MFGKHQQIYQLDDALGDAVILQAPATTTTNTSTVSAPDAETSVQQSVGSTGLEHSVQTNFLDADPGHVVSVPSGLDATFLQGHAPDLEIEDFLNRKVKIKSFAYDTSGAILAQTFNPWELYFDTEAIKRKIENYAFINCTLELEFRINAAPSYFGCFMASYQPLKHFTPSLIIPSSGAAVNVAYSQRPHLYLALETNCGGTMELPFMYYRNWLTLSSKEQFTNMGQITLFPMTPMETVNGDIGKFDISVYARAVNVKLSNTTQAAVLQSDVVKIPTKVTRKSRRRKKKGNSSDQADEFEEPGPISGPASAVADVASQLASVPILAPYARATEMVATGIGNFAKLFGFGRTPVLEDPRFMRNTPFGSMADTQSGETLDRLVLDTKQGTVIDSRTAGLDGRDEMSIKSIATRESYLTQFTWGEGDVADTKLWESDVTPEMWRVQTGLNSSTYPTPMAFASVPFRYWRGSINFRFKAVASQYHRGRFQVQWDPRLVRGNIDSARIEEVTTTTIDLTEDRDVTINIPFAQHLSYLPLAKDFEVENFADGTPVYFGASNGSLKVSVLNELNTFGSSSPITILVMVSMGEDCEFASPVDLPENLQILAEHTPVAQSGEVNMADVRLAGDNSPVGGTTIVEQIKTCPTPDHTSAIFFGERVYSFRSMLKRYNMNYSIPFSGDVIANQRWVKFESVMPRWPLTRGHDNEGLNVHPSGRANFCNLTLFRYVTSAFVGMRGGMRWKVNPCGAQFDDVQMHRSNEIRSEARANQVTSYSNGGAMEFYMDRFAKGGESSAGYSMTNQKTQAGLMIEAPYYSNLRFNSTNPYHSFKGFDGDTSRHDSLYLRMNLFSTDAQPKDMAYTMHCATAEDFNVFFFLNAPTFHIYTNTV